MNQELEEHLELGGVKPGLLRFKQEDFLDHDMLTPWGVAQRAQSVLNDYLEKCPTVFSDGTHVWSSSLVGNPRQRAVLFGVEPMVPPHECAPSSWVLGNSRESREYLKNNKGDFICAVCGERLTPVKWVKA